MRRVRILIATTEVYVEQIKVNRESEKINKENKNFIRNAFSFDHATSQN